MKHLFKIISVATCVYISTTCAWAYQLPYRNQLKMTLSSGGNIVQTPTYYAPAGDFTLDVDVIMSSSSSKSVTLKATNKECVGFELNINPDGVKMGNTILSNIANNDGMKHTFRIALKQKTKTLFIYKDRVAIGTADAQTLSAVIYPAIFTEKDDSTMQSGIYSTKNIIRNPGFEAAEITYDKTVTKSSDTMFWPTGWEVYKGNPKADQWNTGTRCYLDKSTYATGREGLCELMFRQDGGGGMTQGSAVYQMMVRKLKPNKKYRIEFEALSHSNATGYTYAVAVGNKPGTWDVTYQTWTAPSTALTSQNYAIDFTTTSTLSDTCYFAFVGAGTKGIVHLDRITMYQAEGDYNTLNLTSDDDNTQIGEVTYEDVTAGCDHVLTNALYDGGEYEIYHTAYNKVLGTSSDGTSPKISTWAKNDSLSYVFTAVSDDNGNYYLVNRSNGKYLSATTSNTYSMTFNDLPGSSNSSLWTLTTGTDGTIKSVYGGGYLGCDSAKTDDYIGVYYDKSIGKFSTWQIIQADFPLSIARAHLYTTDLKNAITNAEAMYANTAYGAETEKTELATALYNARSAYETASMETLDIVATALTALKAAMENLKSKYYSIWISGSSFNTGNAFTVAMNGTALSTITGVNVQFVIRNSMGTGSIITIGSGYVKSGENYLAQNIDNSGKHDYRFAFDGQLVILYIDGIMQGQSSQYQVPIMTSCGTASEWTVMGTNGLTAYQPEIVSTNAAIAGNDYATNSNGKTERTVLMMQNQTMEISNAVDMHILASSTALASSSINIKSDDAWIIFDNIRPSAVISFYLPSIKINGTPAVNGNNCRVAIYLHGAAVIPHKPTYQAFEGYTGELFSGDKYTYGVGIANMGKAANMLKSFVLKRGYMVCLATNADGSGYSRIYVADHQDKTVSTLPDLLNQRISYIYVRKWNYVSKKGWSTTEGQGATNTEGALVGATWFYNWSADKSTQDDMEYVPHKGHIYWPSWSAINAIENTTAVLGYNEPDHSEQQNGTTIDSWTATTHQPEFMASGLRIGSPAPTDATWLTSFIGHCNDMAYRCDFVCFHAYWGTNEAANAASWKSQLQAIYNNAKRPIWLTEWNNGASWTTETWPSSYSDKLAQQKTAIKNILAVLDDCDFIERYDIYNWDSYYRAVMSWDSNNNNWWVTPCGEVYRDDHPTFAYKESMQFVPVGWFPSFKTALTLTGSISDSRDITFNISNPNGDYTGIQQIEIMKQNGTYETYRTETDRSLFDATSFTQTFSLDNLYPDTRLTGNSLTFRLKVTDLEGKNTAYSTASTISIPESVSNYYLTKTDVGAVKTSDDNINNILIKGGKECITISSTHTATVTIFSTAGAVIRRVNVFNGTESVTLPAGVYIVNSKKIKVE
jgi:hypothetical protein